MPKEYLILQKADCPECNGAGTIQNYLWRQFWEHYNNEPVSGLEMGGWWDEHNNGDIPDEEEDCPECYGEGSITKHVPLQDALLHLLMVGTIGVDCPDCGSTNFTFRPNHVSDGENPVNGFPCNKCKKWINVSFRPWYEVESVTVWTPKNLPVDVPEPRWIDHDDID